MMNIVFNVNNLGLEGLGATLVSLITNCSNSKKLKISFLCSDFKLEDKLNISQLLEEANFCGLVEFIDFDAKKIFGHLKPLHGDWTTFGRLLIADYINSDRALYLDADLLINLDILELDKIDLNESILAAVTGATVEYALECSFFIDKLKWPSDTPYFNAGVIIFNLKKWRTENYDQKWKNIAATYPDDLISHDQTLLNALSAGDFIKLPLSFNSAWFAKSEKPFNADQSIIHFIGSPKPWDYFGKIIHKGYAAWATYNTNFWEKNYGKMSKEKIIRTWNIRRSIVKQFAN